MDWYHRGGVGLGLRFVSCVKKRSVAQISIFQGIAFPSLIVNVDLRLLEMNTDHLIVIRIKKSNIPGYETVDQLFTCHELLWSSLEFGHQFDQYLAE